MRAAGSTPELLLHHVGPDGWARRTASTRGRVLAIG
jgi:hypothetical protein